MASVKGAHDAFKRRDYQIAERFYTEAIDDLSPKEAVKAAYLINRAVCRTHQKKNRDALADYESALELEPQNEELYNRVFKFLFSLADYKSALRIATKWLSNYPQNTNAQNWFATIKSMRYSSVDELVEETTLVSLSDNKHNHSNNGNITDYDQKENTESGLQNSVTYRPLPKAFSLSELTMCDSVKYACDCAFGIRCVQAHSIDELDYWKEQLMIKQNRVNHEDNRNKLTLSDRIEQLILRGADRSVLLSNSLKGVNFYANEDSKVILESKPATQTWIFTLACRDTLKGVTLLESETRSNFTIQSVTIGQKRSQKPFTLTADCKEWSNSKFNADKQSNESVYRVKIKFRSDIYGSFKQTVVFDYNKPIYLAQDICVDVSVSTTVTTPHDDLIICEGFRWQADRTLTVVPYEASCDGKVDELLKKYPVCVPASLSSHIKKLNSLKLNREIYKDYYHSLLYVEESEQYYAVSKYNIKGKITLISRYTQINTNDTTELYAQKGELFARVPLGNKLSEDTTKGRLLLQSVNYVLLASGFIESPKKVYESKILYRCKDHLIIMLNNTLLSDTRWQTGSEVSCQLQFVVNRTPFCEMHSVLDQTDTILDHLFPSSDNVDIPWNTSHIQRRESTTSPHIPALNNRQKECMAAITSPLISHLPPLLIVGPFGTGKTMTLARTVMELLKEPSNRVLICTHSNSAADLYITDFLHPFIESNPSHKLIRVYYQHRWVTTVSEKVWKYTLYEGRRFRVPTQDDILGSNCIITTLSTCYILTDHKLPKGCFTHILIDEAAQAMETEILVPLVLAGEKTRIALAGDHMQMNPEVCSELTRKHGLQRSLLDRLFSIYATTHPCTITLNENYRSHKVIVEYASDLFYDGQLLARGKQNPHPDHYPLVFYAARGKSEQHDGSTGYFNDAEVFESADFVQLLVNSWPSETWGEFSSQSVGVVAPYMDQVTRIRSELKKRDKILSKVNVERVFNVQGKQYRVIVISTVRTHHTCSFVELQKDFGFLTNPKVLNTAITRAQSLVVVIGDPMSLCTVGKCRTIWKRFMEECSDHGALNGVNMAQINDYVDYLDMKKSYKLNPLAKGFLPKASSQGSNSDNNPISSTGVDLKSADKNTRVVNPHVSQYNALPQGVGYTGTTNNVRYKSENQILTDTAIIEAGAPIQGVITSNMIKQHSTTTSLAGTPYYLQRPQLQPSPYIQTTSFLHAPLYTPSPLSTMSTPLQIINQTPRFSATPQMPSYNIMPQLNPSYNTTPQLSTYQTAPQIPSYNAAAQILGSNTAPQIGTYNPASQVPGYNPVLPPASYYNSTATNQVHLLNYNAQIAGTASPLQTRPQILIPQQKQPIVSSSQNHKYPVPWIYRREPESPFTHIEPNIASGSAFHRVEPQPKKVPIKILDPDDFPPIRNKTPTNNREAPPTRTQAPPTLGSAGSSNRPPWLRRKPGQTTSTQNMVSASQPVAHSFYRPSFKNSLTPESPNQTTVPHSASYSEALRQPRHQAQVAENNNISGRHPSNPNNGTTRDDLYTPEVRDIFKQDIQNQRKESVYYKEPSWMVPAIDTATPRGDVTPTWFNDREADPAAEDFSQFGSNIWSTPPDTAEVNSSFKFDINQLSQMGIN